MDDDDDIFRRFFRGIGLNIFHAVIFSISIILLISDFPAIKIMIMIVMIWTYALNWWFGDCIVTIWEAEESKITAASALGSLLIPCFPTGREASAVAGSTIVFIFFIYAVYSFLVEYVFNWANDYKEQKEQKEQKERNERRKIKTYNFQFGGK